MVDTRPVRRGPRPGDPVEGTALVSSAQLLDADNTRSLIITPREWQREAWAFYRSLGELRYAVSDWLGNALSRVQLVPAIARPGKDPEPITDGPVVDIVGALAGGIGGQAAMLKKLAVHLTVPGDSYLVGEETTEGTVWRVCSSTEIRIKGRKRLTQLFSASSTEIVVYEVMEGESVWRELSDDSLVVRVWHPDEEYSWRATSPCEAALPIMREIDFYNRYIIAVLLSRLALNGLLLIPSEVTFPVKEQFKNSADPFVAELIDIASRSIANPGSASAALPIPLKVPAQYIEQFRHITFETQMGEKVLEDREKALRRLATSLNLPAEILLGVGNVNHWGQWQLEESAIKIHISPIAEIICVAFTRGYLEPMLKAEGLSNMDASGGRYIIWYNTDGLSQVPDRSGDAQTLHDRGAVSDQTLRDASGFNEEDAPSDEDLKKIVLRKIAMSAGADALRALSLLTGDESLLPPAPTVVAPSPGGETAPVDQPTSPSPGAPTKSAPETRPTQPVPSVPANR